jgi:hypothetical protein
MSDFPNAALMPFDATPRIRPDTAGRIVGAVNELRMRQKGDFPTSPAILVAVWTGVVVKYLVNEEEARETLCRLELALQNREVPGPPNPPRGSPQVG